MHSESVDPAYRGTGADDGPVTQTVNDNSLTTKSKPNFIYRLGPYCAVSTIRLSYKTQPVNDV